MAWLYLLAAAVCEIAWAIGLKYTEGFTRLWPTVATAAIMILSFFLLSQAVKTLPLGTAYAIWTGIGAAGTAVLGMILFQESHDVWRIVCLLLIVSGTLGLKLVSPH
jgi:quaternary ammonium compound-resistance protein SugE